MFHTYDVLVDVPVVQEFNNARENLKWCAFGFGLIGVGCVVLWMFFKFIAT